MKLTRHVCLMCVCFSDIMNNKVFYQHPNLMRVLGMHETVMEVMVNVLGGGESKVGDTKTRSQTHCIFTEEFQALLCTHLV